MEGLIQLGLRTPGPYERSFFSKKDYFLPIIIFHQDFIQKYLTTKLDSFSYGFHLKNVLIPEEPVGQ